MKWEELSANQKQKVLENNYDINVDYDWWDMTYEDAENVGIEIRGFDLGRGQDCDVKFTWDALDIAREILKLHGEQCGTYTVAQNYIAEYMRVKFETDPEEEPDTYDIDIQFQKDIENEYWKILDQEFDYRTSEEAIIEAIEANEFEFEFDEDGDII